MRPKLEDEKKRVKVSITLNKKTIDFLEKDIVNKSKLIEKLLNDYYGEKSL